MSFARRLSVTITTNASGDGTGYINVDYGLLSQLRYAKASSGGYSDGVDIVVTIEGTGEAVLSVSNTNASATWAPRQPTHTTAGVASVYASTDGVLDKIAIADDRIKIVVSNGGDTKVGVYHAILV